MGQGRAGAGGGAGEILGGGGRGRGGSGPDPENLLRYRACYRPPHGCGEAGQRLGSLCAIEVEGLKRRPPTEVGGLGLEFRV